ncbi:MAG: sulfite exporter TauE/SafE family protein [Chloroflexi bacterium]|nr:sulfite exporter TauE/SafE family protein [Chloroflexota bacterium]
MEFLALPLGLLVGLSLGVLGAGGSILIVPMLVYVLGFEPKAAITTSLVVVGLVSLGGMVTHWRAGRVRVGTGIAFGLAGILGSLGGSYLNRAVDSNILLLAFAGLMLVAAWAMVRNREAQPSVPASTSATGGRIGVLAAARVEPALAAKVVVAGSTVGFITGFFGIGGGFVIVPALSVVLGLTMQQAAGTSLLVIAINVAIALGPRLGGEALPWEVIVLFTVAGLVGAVVGSGIAGKVRSELLARSFAGLIVVIAIYTVVRTIIAL